MPSSFKLNGQEGKYLLKKTMEPLLPAEVLYRPKMGFAVPLARWFREPLKERVRDAMLGAKSFKVETKRSDKSFHMTSIQLSQYVGGELAEAFPDTAVDVHHPELTVHLEVRDYAAYVHAAPTPGAGGMPVGSNGRAVTLLSGGIDSPVSSYMIARRGVKVVPVHFFSFPYTSEAAKEKVLTLARLLTDYCGSMCMYIVPFTHIQEEIRDKCPEEYFTLVMRRFMMRIAERVAKDNRCSAIVTGENLGLRLPKYYCNDAKYNQGGAMNCKVRIRLPP